MPLYRRLVAEGLGTAFLLAVVVGSGIMGAALAGGNDAIALLANSMATGAALVVLITIFGPVSGAHFNPAVTLAFRLRGEIETPAALAYVGVQIAGAVLGVIVAHLMFDLDALQVSATPRASTGLWLAEAVAAFGLVLAILGALRADAAAVPMIVGLYITAAYWFTASTSFANPAVTMARALTDTFAGIAPAHVPAFVAMQIAGAVLAVSVARALFAAR